MDWGHREQIVIPDESTTSNAFSTGPYRESLAIKCPTMTGATVSFTGSETREGTFVAVNNDAGAAISWSVVDGQIIGGPEDEVRILLAVPFLKVVSASTESAGPLTLTVFMK